MIKDSGYYKILCAEVAFIRESVVDSLVYEQDDERAKILVYELKSIYSLMQRFQDLNNEKNKKEE